MEDVYEIIRRIEERIAGLPAGYISRKTIKGKVQHYRQWREDGKIKSKYIREDELEEIRDQIGERKQLEERLKELKKQVPIQEVKAMKFETNLITGAALGSMVRNVRELEKRDCFEKLVRYLRDDKNWTRVCAVYGLRRTGKTTMLYQAIADMNEEEREKAAYVKMRNSDIMNNLVHDLDTLYHAGYKYIFIDEVTLMEDFIDYLRVRRLPMWQRGEDKFERSRRFCTAHSDPADYVAWMDKASPEALCNVGLILSRQTDYLLFRYIESVKSDFLKRGGIREQMARARIQSRSRKPEN